MKLPKHYDSKTVEPKWRKYWEKEEIYKFNKKSKLPIYSIDVPPPYASAGHLHVGHALSYTQFEITARLKRMQGFNVYFAPCFDNNGLPTEKYVEEKFGIDKSTTNRADFIKLCREESKKVEKVYAENVFKKLGHSYDWSLLYTTISPEAQKVSQTSFLKLIKQGDCYRSEEPTIWCTKHQTALAQAEVEDVDRTTKLNYIYFNVNNQKIGIATTRPELLSSCVGIFVHPDDNRYKKLIGKKATVPIFNYKVPIMTDEKVDKEFGSGIVMICTFGDTTDIEWWRKHKLPLKISIDPDGTLNENAKKYKGMALSEARDAILRDLENEGRLTKQEDLKQTVGGCWRCSTPVEFIVTKQWFIKALDYKKELIQQGKKVRWWPGFFFKRYEDWVKNLNWNWCISRQRYYGVPIPVWYCKKCSTPLLPEEKNLPIDPMKDKPKNKCKCGSSEFQPEDDVFDTWMTSSMTPQIAIRWLEQPDEFKKRFPTQLRPQSHDIIRTWAFYTILKSYLHFKEIPWTDVSINTYVLDSKGRAMHKSKGNAVWADELLEKYSVDAFRHWVGTASYGSDVPFKEQELVAGEKTITKLWNASKFVLSHLEDYKGNKPKLEAFDTWLLAKLNKVIKTATDYFDKFEYGKANKEINNFFWNTFCDNYLEIIKDRVYNPDKRGSAPRISAQYSLNHSLSTILKLFAPIMPFITEEIFHLYFDKKEKSIHISNWPKYDPKLTDKKLEAAGSLAIDIIAAVRKEKADKNISLGQEIKQLTIKTKHQKALQPFLDDIKSTTRAQDIVFKGEAATTISEDTKIGISP
ncbi:valine--tRNA ligase [Candidatus Woesearchaeota archaeon]|nr:valine--tRNA ligase [Candidatus Woesearchaeota archaeon]